MRCRALNPTLVELALKNARRGRGQEDGTTALADRLGIETANRIEGFDVSHAQGRAAVGKKTAAMAQAGVLDTGTSVGVLDQNRVDAESLWNPRFVGCNARLGKKRTAAGAQCSGCRSRVGAALSQLRARYRSDDT